jgi:DNA repair exonuclease SbcCD ATPase subunit
MENKDKGRFVLMTTDEFQRLVLEKLESLEKGQKNLEERQKNLEVGQKGLEERQKNLELGQKCLEEGQKSLGLGQRGLEDGQKQILIKLEAVIEQTADLTEFKHEVKQELADIKSNISRIEINTAENWRDIARLKSAR